MTVRDDDPPAPADAAEPRRLLEDPGLYGSDRSTSWALGPGVAEATVAMARRIAAMGFMLRVLGCIVRGGLCWW